LVLQGAVIFLRFVMPPLQSSQDSDAPQKPFPWLGLGQIMLMAIAVTWGGAIILSRWGNLFGETTIFLGLDVVSSLNLLLAVAAVPVGWLAIRYAKYPLFAIALGWLSVILMILMSAPGVGLSLLALVWVWAFGTMRNGTIPYIFNVMSARWQGVGIGLFFGVSGLAMHLFPNVLPAANLPLQNVVGILGLAIATILALLPLMSEAKLSQNLSDEVQ
jgi:MFS family permease